MSDLIDKNSQQEMLSNENVKHHIED